MDINSIQGANAYTATQTGASLEKQNREAIETDLTRENARPAQEAFEVNITQEARAASETENNTQAEQSPPAEQSPAADPNTQQPVSRIVDIVA